MFSDRSNEVRKTIYENLAAAEIEPEIVEFWNKGVPSSGERGGSSRL